MQLERVRENFDSILRRAAEAARRAGRPADSWRLVAVTKTVPAEVASALVGLGARDLGENRVPDLVRKAEVLREKQVRWHMIGHLQRNKVRKVVGVAELIHSVDSLRLAEEIDRVCAARGVSQNVLLEVNVSGEETKHGLTPARLPQAAVEIAALGNVRLCGLMTMAPIVSDAEETRGVFSALRRLGEALAREGLFAGDDYELSMGMTQDFEVAIEEGATLIRVGSALFEGVTI